MNMQNAFEDMAALEKELSEIAPLVRQAFERAGGPSLCVDERIRQEALRTVTQQQRRWRGLRARVLATAAACALLLGGSMHLLVSRQPKASAPVTRHNTAQENVQPDENTASFANLLLEIQGLNEESFFRTEEAESLWL